MTPFAEIQKDLVMLIKLAYEGSIHAPDFHRHAIQKKCERTMKKYKIKTRKFPKP